MKTDLSIYIHIPFCVRKCKYCDFLSFPADEKTYAQYVDELLKELKENSDSLKNRNVISIFIGGGTPSILNHGLISKLINEIRFLFSVDDDVEITIEVNPGTVDEKKLKEYRDVGINRLSIGLQSANDEELKMLGRIHSYDTFLDTYKLARKNGFDNINVDLISALPNQTVQNYRKSLETVISLNPEHISAYSLQLEENTFFFDHKDEYDWPDEDMDRELYYLTDEILSQHGFKRYEISNYSRENYECRHNKVYWVRGNYLGIGIGAASLIDDIRYRNTSDLGEYMSGMRVVEKEPLSEKDCMEEFMFLGLRLTDGIATYDFKKEFGIDIRDIYGGVIDKLVSDDLLEVTDTNIKLTKRGMDVSNYVFTQFLIEQGCKS